MNINWLDYQTVHQILVFIAPYLIFYLAMAFILVILIIWQLDKDPRFDFKTALLDPITNRVSFGELGQLVSLVMSTVIIVSEAAHGRLTEWLFTSYMAIWAGSFIANKYMNNKKTDTTVTNTE